MSAPTTLTALALNCTLTPSPDESSTQLMADLVLGALGKHGVTGDSVRLVDLDVRPGVLADMGAGDAWPGVRERMLAADIVVVAAGASNSAKLLLQSANDRHPNGLANGSDQVGRNYMYHNSKAVVALSKERNDTVFQKTLGLNDFYFGSDDYEYPLGNIQMVGKSSAPMYRGEKPLETRLAPTRTLESMARHAVDFWLSTEDLPRPENRVTLDRDGHVRLSYKQTNHESAKRLYHKLKGLLAHAGMHPDHLIPRHAYLKTDIPVAGVAHQAGTCRFGSDPATSMLDLDCKAHELDNLYITDASFFPSIGAVNPTLTIIANALRVADRIKERLAA